jgi:hypothetical protein
VLGTRARASGPSCFQAGSVSTLATLFCARDDSSIEPPINHHDVTTIMSLLGYIHEDVAEIRNLLEEDRGEEEAPEADS